MLLPVLNSPRMGMCGYGVNHVDLYRNGRAKTDRRQGCRQKQVIEATDCGHDVRRRKVIAFNGAKAEQLFHRHVQSLVHDRLDEIVLRGLPSTSPANARMNFDEKLAAWRMCLSD